MARALLVLTVVLLIGTGICNAICQHLWKVTPVDINMDELAGKRLNIVYLEEGDWRTPFDHLYIDIRKSEQFKYKADHTYVFNEFVKIFDESTIYYKRGVMTFVYEPKIHGIDLSKYRHHSAWYILAKTNDGAMLVYDCTDRAVSDDQRYIIVPSNSTVCDETKFYRVPSTRILSKESLIQLVRFDRYYSFAGKLKKVPYALQDVH